MTSLDIAWLLEMWEHLPAAMILKRRQTGKQNRTSDKRPIWNLYYRCRVKEDTLLMAVIAAAPLVFSSW